MRVDVHGPLFDGRADIAAREMLHAMKREVAQQGARMVHENLGQVLKHPTGYYQSHVTASAVGVDWQITDRGVIYGPWLEGTGSRNKTTRFKGYATFRRTTQELRRRVPMIVAPILNRYLRRMQ